MFPYTSYAPSLWLLQFRGGGNHQITHRSDAVCHITAAITSWWGANQKGEQLRVPTLLTTAADIDPTFRVALYYEKEGIGAPSVPELKHDLEYILENYGNQKNYLHIGGRPVPFVYNADDSDCSMLNRWAAAHAPATFHLEFKVFPGWSSCPLQPDGWHKYAPAQPHIEVAGFQGRRIVRHLPWFRPRAGHGCSGRAAPPPGPRPAAVVTGYPRHGDVGAELATDHNVQRMG
jgi:hypothetical protein